jgi:MFS family permease
VLQRLGFPAIGRHRQFVTAITVDAIGSGVFMPISVLYFLESTSLSLARIGLALSIASALRLPFSPMLGGLVDRIGAKPVLLAANLLQAVGFIGYVFAESFAAVLAASAVVQLGQMAFWSSFSPVVAAISELGERERWFGFLGALRNASFAIGGLAAAAVITIGSDLAFTAVVIVNAASYVAAYVLLLSVEGPRPGGAAASTDGLPTGWGRVLRDRPYLLLVVTNYTYATSAMALNVAMPVYITTFLGLPGWVAGAVFTINTIMIGLGQGLAVNAMEGSVRTRIIALGSLLFAGSYVLLLSADWTTVPVGVVVVFVAAIVYTGGELFAGPVLNALSTDAAPTSLRGRYVSLYQMSWNVASTIAPAALTWLLDTGAAAVWGALAAVSVVGIGLSTLLRRTMPLAAATVPGSRPTASTTPTASAQPFEGPAAG